MLSYTIYARHGNPQRPLGSVGITFPPTPDLTYGELLSLISELNKIEREMRSIPKP